jgi:hypothetical protein
MSKGSTINATPDMGKMIEFSVVLFDPIKYIIYVYK